MLVVSRGTFTSIGASMSMTTLVGRSAGGGGGCCSAMEAASERADDVDGEFMLMVTGKSLLGASCGLSTMMVTVGSGIRPCAPLVDGSVK